MLFIFFSLLLSRPLFFLHCFFLSCLFFTFDSIDSSRGDVFRPARRPDYVVKTHAFVLPGFVPDCLFLYSSRMFLFLFPFSFPYLIISLVYFLPSDIGNVARRPPMGPLPVFLTVSNGDMIV